MLFWERSRKTLRGECQKKKEQKLFLNFSSDLHLSYVLRPGSWSWWRWRPPSGGRLRTHRCGHRLGSTLLCMFFDILYEPTLLGTRRPTRVRGRAFKLAGFWSILIIVTLVLTPYFHAEKFGYGCSYFAFSSEGSVIESFIERFSFSS